MTTMQARRESVEATVEDVAWMLAHGEHPTRIAARLGRTVTAVEQLLRREGRYDLAQPFYAERDRGRTTR